MSCQDKVKVKLDPTYRGLLKDLSIAYLSDEPSDFLEYACQFFGSRLEQRDRRRGGFIPLSFTEGEDMAVNCRMTIRGDSVNPEELHGEGYDPPVHPKTQIQRLKLENALKEILFFKFLLDLDRDHLIDVMFKMNVLANDRIITEGDKGDFFYIIESGEFEAFTEVKNNIKVLKCYNGEGYFGELALLHNAPRAVSIRAKTDGILWALDRTTFRNVLLRTDYERMKCYTDFLQEVPVLKSLTDKERLKIAECLKSKLYNPGQLIVAEGAVGDGMYFVMSGKARITTSTNEGAEKQLKTVIAGDYFGELSLITKNPRAASVYAVDRVHVAFLPSDAFERLLGPCIEVMKRNFEEYDNQLNQLYKTSLQTQRRNFDM